MELLVLPLAIHIDKHIGHQFFRTDPRRRFTTQLFGIVGGVAFLTLVVNGTTCGPLLKKLGLAKTGEARKNIATSYVEDIKVCLALAAHKVSCRPLLTS